GRESFAKASRDDCRRTSAAARDGKHSQQDPNGWQERLDHLSYEPRILQPKQVIQTSAFFRVSLLSNRSSPEGILASAGRSTPVDVLKRFLVPILCSIGLLTACGNDHSGGSSGGGTPSGSVNVSAGSTATGVNVSVTSPQSS